MDEGDVLVYLASQDVLISMFSGWFYGDFLGAIKSVNFDFWAENSLGWEIKWKFFVNRNKSIINKEIGVNRIECKKIFDFRKLFLPLK